MRTNILSPRAAALLLAAGLVGGAAPVLAAEPDADTPARPPAAAPEAESPATKPAAPAREPAKSPAAEQPASPPAPAGDDGGPAADATDEEGLPLDQLRAFVEILNRVKQDYVEPISDEKLLQNAIDGMVDQLDPHSAYLDKQASRELSISTSGKFGGLGIQVQLQNGYLRVISPIDDTPAAKAGIRAGDRIVRIDGKPVRGMSLSDSVDAMRGEPGSKITITLLRKEADQPITKTLERANIDVQSVRSRMLEPRYAYIRISEFSGRAGHELNDALDKLQKKADEPIKGLVLDLRNNPGGVLSAAVDVADAFIDGGTVVSIHGRGAGTDQTFKATAGDRLNGAPIVVLVNEGSASASEIVAGALQDEKRAVIMGQRTFGKGSVQTVMPLKNGSALKLTTARYYTPSGRSIQSEGIVPDVATENVKIVAGDDPAHGMAYSEADLAGALQNDTDPGASRTPTAEQRSIARDNAKLARSDYGIYEALNLLKGLNILDRTRMAAAPTEDTAAEPAD